MPEWIIVYSDGTEYTNDQIRYKDIDKNKAARFHLFIHNGKQVIVYLDPSKRLIYRKRNALNAITNNIDELVYIVGWQKTVNNINFQSLNFIFEDGRVEMLDRFQENHPWFYPVKFDPYEVDGG